MVVAETTIPKPWTSPLIRTHPHRGFSRAMRRIRARVSGSMGGRPGAGRRLEVHLRRTSSRCHRTSVAGVRMNAAQRSRGSTLLIADRNSLSSDAAWGA
jgi:hypothetical protein